MTDKERIKEWAENNLSDVESKIKGMFGLSENLYPDLIAKRVVLKDLLFLINSMQEEPVSIWHDSNKEQPNFASTVVIWSPKYKNGEIISRCTEVYSDRIWAYIDDLLKM